MMLLINRKDFEIIGQQESPISKSARKGVPVSVASSIIMSNDDLYCSLGNIITTQQVTKLNQTK